MGQGAEGRTEGEREEDDEGDGSTSLDVVAVVLEVDLARDDRVETSQSRSRRARTRRGRCRLTLPVRRLAEPTTSLKGPTVIRRRCVRSGDHQPEGPKELTRLHDRAEWLERLESRSRGGVVEAQEVEIEPWARFMQEETEMRRGDLRLGQAQVKQASRRHKEVMLHAYTHTSSG